MTLTKHQEVNTITENIVEELLDFFYYNNSASTHPSGQDAVDALPCFISKLVSHHTCRDLPIPSFYSDEGDVAFNYSMINGKNLYVYLELPKLLGYGSIYNQASKEVELTLDGTQNEDNFWKGLENLLGMIV